MRETSNSWEDAIFQSSEAPDDTSSSLLSCPRLHTAFSKYKIEFACLKCNLRMQNENATELLRSYYWLLTQS